MLTTFKVRLSKKTQLTPSVFLFHFQLIDPQEINFLAGQYLILSVPQPSGNFIKRLYSIASAPTEKNSLELVVEVVNDGAGTTYLKNLNINDEVIFQGPAGAFTLKENDKNKIFLATGTGIAPTRSMIRSQISDLRFKIFLYWGLKYFRDIYLFEELKNYALRITNFNFKICLSREENLDMIKDEDKKYFSLGHIDSQCPKTKDADYYLCGSPQIVESLQKCILQNGTPQENIFSEKF